MTMTATAFRDALVELGWTQVYAASYFDVNDRTVRRWVASDQPVPRSVELHIKDLLGKRRRVRRRAKR